MLSVLIRIFILSIALTWTSAAHAQIVIEVPGRADLPLAAPEPATPQGDPRRSAPPIWQTLLKDLKTSGYFSVIDPAAYLDRSPGVEPGTFPWEQWTPLRTAVLVKTRLLPPGDTRCDPAGIATCLDVFVYHGAATDLLVKKRLRTSSENARHLGHRAADVVIEAVTGRRGIFGARLAAVSSQGGNKEVVLIDIDGQGLTSVTRNGSINISPALSSDGTSLAWTSYKKGNPDVFVKDLQSGRTRVISNLLGVNISPAFSPNGQQLALARSGDSDADIVIVDARTGALVKQVTTGGGIDVAPSWSPDSSRIVFASERSGGSQIYQYEITTGALTRLTFNGDFNSDPAFSPDGSEIAFVSRSDTGFDIAVVSADGKNVRRITQDTADNEDPAWSPDGMYLVFSSTRTGRSELWLSTADGRHQMALTRSGGWSQPAWVPGD